VESRQECLGYRLPHGERRWRRECRWHSLHLVLGASHPKEAYTASGPPGQCDACARAERKERRREVQADRHLPAPTGSLRSQWIP